MVMSGILVAGTLVTSLAIVINEGMAHKAHLKSEGKQTRFLYRPSQPRTTDRTGYHSVGCHSK